MKTDNVIILGGLAVLGFFAFTRSARAQRNGGEAAPPPPEGDVFLGPEGQSADGYYDDGSRWWMADSFRGGWQRVSPDVVPDDVKMVYGQ